MTDQLTTESPYILNAVVERHHSPQLRTSQLSSTNLSEFLGDHPAAITVAPAGTVNTEHLLHTFIDQWRLFQPLIKQPKNTNRWMVFVALAHNQFQIQKVVLRKDFGPGDYSRLIRLLKGFRSRSRDAKSLALVPEGPWAFQRKEQIGSALSSAFHIDLVPYIPRVTEASHDAAPSDRKRLILERKKMLDEVGTYTSEQLADAAASTSSNASQFAADQRSASKIFGVRFGREWRYPRFQFDSRRFALAEMKEVLTALSPDDEGWDRLQWFLEPHEALQGKTPLRVWKTNRNKVIEAANTERWNGRD